MLQTLNPLIQRFLFHVIVVVTHYPKSAINPVYDIALLTHLIFQYIYSSVNLDF